MQILTISNVSTKTTNHKTYILLSKYDWENGKYNINCCNHLYDFDLL
jgi:hypothetical protein